MEISEYEKFQFTVGLLFFHSAFKMEIELLISITGTVFEKSKFFSSIIGKLWLLTREILMEECDHFGISVTITYMFWSLKCWNDFENKIPIHQKLEWLSYENWSGSESI